MRHERESISDENLHAVNIIALDRAHPRVAADALDLVLADHILVLAIGCCGAVLRTMNESAAIA